MPDRAISVRLDADAQRALDRLVASGMSQSQAIRHALVLAAGRAAERSSLTAEVLKLVSDEDDRKAKAELLDFMGEVDAPR